MYLIKMVCRYQAHAIANYMFTGTSNKSYPYFPVLHNQFAIRAAAFYNDEVIVRLLLQHRGVDPSWNLSEAHAWAWQNENHVICRLLRQRPGVQRTMFVFKHNKLTSLGVRAFQRITV